MVFGVYVPNRRAYGNALTKLLPKVNYYVNEQFFVLKVTSKKSKPFNL